MTLELAELPQFMILEPGAGIRLDIHLRAPSCEIDAELEAPMPGKSFIIMIGHKGGPFVQRARISGGARLLFDPESPGEYVLMLVNPMDRPVTVRLQGHGLGRPPRRVPRAHHRGRGGRPPAKRVLTRSRVSRRVRRVASRPSKPVPSSSPGIPGRVDEGPDSPHGIPRH